MKDKQIRLLKRITEVLNWRQEIERGEMIQDRFHKKEYMSFEGTISCDDLDVICDAVNDVFKRLHTKYRVGWSAGEIIPYKEKKS